MAGIGEALRAFGFVHVRGPLGREQCRALASSLGQVVSEERVALRAGAHAYLAKPGPVPLHTDHPEVGVIGWLCEVQDEVDGGNLLLDAGPVVRALGDERRAVLRGVHLALPRLEGGPPTERWPVLRALRGRDAVFCSPWLRAVDASRPQEAALAQLRQLLSERAARSLTEVRLQPGEALFVDNTRILHGRRAIGDGSRRRLQRFWIRAAAEG